MNATRWMASLGLAVGLVAGATHAEAPIPLKDWVRHAQYSEAKISPDGRFLAITEMDGDKTVLVTLRMSDMKLLRKQSLSDDKSIGAFYWVGPDRLVFTAVMNLGHYAVPFGTGEWYAMDVDGGHPRTLLNYGSNGLPGAPGQAIVHYNEQFSMLDPLPEDPSSALMLKSDNSKGGLAEIVSIDTTSGKRRVLARAPRDHCSLVLDEHRQPRFANCYDSKDDAGNYASFSELYRRADDGTWTLVNRSKTNGHHIDVLGTAADGRIYATSDDQKHPAAFGTLDRGTNQFEPLYQDPVAEPARYIVGSDGSTILGVISMAGAPHVEIVEKQSPDVGVYASLLKAFPDELVDFSSATSDGNQIVVSLASDTDPGQLYLFDRTTGQVRFLMRNASWLDPAKMASVKPFSFKTRDGITMYGYLTAPRGIALSKLPMIVNPHGGPIGPRDDWGFNPEAQMLANHGYLVLQLNYRGSGGYGQAFQDMGHREWGGKMQDDLTDVTHWAVDQGYADPSRICIYGGSYGGYASLMGVAKEPDLYKCAVGYVGVYDLELMSKKGDISQSASGKRFLVRTMGTDKDELQRRSPTHLASKIKVPVFLAAGGRDVRAPKEHTEEMRDALAAAGHPAEVVIIEPKEMHGFYDETANLNLYTKMLAFFDKYIGAGSSASASTSH